MADVVGLSVIDAKFPQLDQVLNPRFMRDYLQTHWLGDDVTARWVIENCILGEKRHKPGREFGLSYALTIHDRSRQEKFQQVLTAKLFGRGQEKIPTGLISDSAKTNGLPPVSFLPGLNMLVRAFPYDDKLLNLPFLHSPDFLLAYFNGNPHLGGLATDERVRAVDFTVMHYLPEKSCMTRYKLEIVSVAKSGTSRTQLIYGKHYPDDTGNAVHDLMARLARQTPYCPLPLGYDEALATAWQTQVPGQALEWHPDIIHSPILVAQLADCIAAFHASCLEINQAFGFADIFKQLSSCTRLAYQTNAELGGRIADLEQALLKLHAQLDWSGRKPTPLHMDLKLGNLLSDGRQVCLIDFDGLCFGDSLVDIGSFIANLYLNGLRAAAPVEEIDHFVAQFLAAYQNRIDWRLNRGPLNWYIAAALLHEVVRRSIRQQDVERLKLVDGIIGLSRGYLKAATENSGF